ncbi:hypothetical protein F4803DRAFT_533179 [Xylaria telfairii]|nr:hypothetical protein F4803DRAFT_533179 [Xylaria telfairii]
MMLSIVGIGMRAFLLLVASVVLGLSIALTRHQAIGPVPPQTGFGTFAGAAGFFASALGMWGLWFDHIDGKILISLDTLVSFIYLAGAVSLTMALESVSSCTAMDDVSQYDRYVNDILNGGCVHTHKAPLCFHAVSPDGKDLTPGRCQTAQADYVFEYIGFIFGIAMVFLGYVLNRRGRGGSPASNML